jgi:hypothetical protein
VVRRLIKNLFLFIQLEYADVTQYMLFGRTCSNKSPDFIVNDNEESAKKSLKREIWSANVTNGKTKKVLKKSIKYSKVS